MSHRLALPQRAPFGPMKRRGPLSKVADAASLRVRMLPVNVVSVNTQLHTSAATSSEPGEDLGWRTDFDSAYVKGKILGQGSFGVVHLGINLRKGHEVAIKIMPKCRNKLSKEKTLEKVVRETEILERLQFCKSVVQLEDCFEDDANVALVMEYCGGGDLQQFVDAHGPLDELGLALVAREVLRVVEACHHVGILHGDVKPANFCLKHERKNPLLNLDAVIQDEEPWLKALDFGCSQHIAGPTAGLYKRLSKRTGTPVYMAPEIYRRNYSRPVDVWSTGVMLFWLYCKRFPFFPTAGSVKATKLEDVMEAVCDSEIAFCDGPWLQMSPEGLDFIRRCLCRDENQRLTVADALAHPWLKKLPKSGDSLRHLAQSSHSSPAA